MAYPPLAEVRKNLRVKWYRCNIDRETLRELSQRSDLQGWLQAGGHLGLWLLTGALSYTLWLNGQWVLLSLVLFFHGTVASFFVGTAPHELGHGTVFKSRRLNKVFLYLISMLGWWDPYAYASSHTYHHRYTLHPEGDRENLLPLSPLIGPTFLIQLFSINLLTQRGRTFGKGGLISTVVVTLLAAFGRVGPTDASINEWIRALHEDQPEEYRKSIWWSRLLLVFHGAIITLSIVSGQWILAIIISASPFIANWLSYAVGMTQHCGLKENDPDFRKCVRSITLNPVAEFLYWHMNWHTEHHMFVGVPCYNLKKLHKAIADEMPAPRTLLEAWREMRDTWELQKEEPSYYFDTPVPVAVDVVEAGEFTNQSLGELAPMGLKDETTH